MKRQRRPRKAILREAKPLSIASFYKESDKGCAIILGTLVEEQLADLHEAHITLISSVGSEPLNRLFGAFGPLSTFEGKTLIGFAYGLISRDEFEDLNLLR